MREQQFTTPRPVHLDIKVAAGQLQIVTVDGEVSTVVLDGSPKVVDATAARLRGDRLVIEQQRRSVIGWFGRLGEPLQVKAQVPPGSTVAIVTASGDTHLDGDFAALEMHSASGGVYLSGDLSGDAVVKTVSGEVHLRHVAGDVTVQSVSGDATADSVGGSVEVKSVSGDLRVGSLREGTVNVQSVSGRVELGLASGTDVDIDASSASGEVSSEVPLSDRPSDDPGPTVVIRSNTVSGDIRVFRAASASRAPVPAS